MSEQTLTAKQARKDLYQVIRSDLGFEEKAQDALELGRQYLGVDNGHLTRIDRETNHWEALVSTDTVDGQFPPGLTLDLETTYCRRTIEADDQIVLHDAPNQGWADDPAFETHGLHCYHGTTLVLDGEPYGTVCFVAEDPRGEPFSDGETMFAELLARLLERELEREQHEAELTKQTNLAIVFNRVLRHNLRNDMAIARGYTEMMGEKLGDDPICEIALSNIDNLLELSQKARELDQIVAATFERKSTDIVTIIEDVVETVTQEYPEASVTVEYDERTTVAVLPSFERALEELVENAAKHGGSTPAVTVSVESSPNAVEIHIEDDGPGLADHEIDVLKTGTETPLTHGSGLGLWLAHWIVSSHDGTIEAADRGTGTTMSLSVPRTPSATDRQQMTKLERARDQYRAAFEEASDGMVIVDDDARIVEANSAASTIYGANRQQLLGRPIPEFLPATFDFEAAWHAFQNGEIDHDTVTIVGDDGIERRVEYSATTDIVPGQHLIISRDVTDQTEQRRELERKTRAMDAAPISMTMSDPSQEDNPIVYANEQFEALTGYTREEIYGQNCRFLQGSETDPEAVRKIREAIDAAEPVTVELTNYRNDGSSFTNRVTVAPVRNDNGELTNFVGFQERVDGGV